MPVADDLQVAGGHASAAPRDWEPAYFALHRSGALAERARRAWEHLASCDLCARYCRIDRHSGIEGAVCRTGEKAVVYSYGPHHGEEDPLRGTRGSGTIFFSWCNLRCVYCQNWEISHKGAGEEVEPEALAEMMLALQRQGCHNVNFVSPSHVVAPILAALEIAAGEGLRLPLVFNTGGYDSTEALELLDGVIDIYMPDMKYGDPAEARYYSKVRDYVKFNRAAIKEMHRQVGDLILDEEGIARHGLLVRHLVLPDDIVSSESCLEFLAEEISQNSYLNLMDQYRPCYRAANFPPLGRPTSSEEYARACQTAARLGLRQLDRRVASTTF